MSGSIDIAVSGAAGGVHGARRAGGRHRAGSARTRLVLLGAIPLLLACTRAARVHVSAAEIAVARDRFAHRERVDLLTGDGTVQGGRADVLGVESDDGSRVTFAHRVTLEEALRSVHGGATITLEQDDHTQTSDTARALTLSSLVLFGGTTPVTIAGEAYQLFRDRSLQNVIPTTKLGWYRSILVFEVVTFTACVVGGLFWLASGLVFRHKTDLGEGRFVW